MYFKLLVIVFFSFLISCQSSAEQNTEQNLTQGIHKVIVEEVQEAETYTYLRVKENGVETWLAISKRSVNKDDVLYYNTGLEMRDFKSKELDKTFDSILFVDEISDDPNFKSQKETPVTTQGNSRVIAQEEVSITPAKDGITIAELFSKRDSYSGKRVVIKGKAVKYNTQIMGKNWVHIQDGTNDKGNFDLTVTTNDVVKVGDVVTFDGKITLNKDFGAGYSYEVIMEEAKLISNL